jgi:hypothetical protein
MVDKYPVVNLDEPEHDRVVERAQRHQHVENRMRLFEEYDLLCATCRMRHIDEEKLFYFLLNIKELQYDDPTK